MGIVLLIAATPVIAVFLFAAYALIRGSIIRANEAISPLRVVQYAHERSSSTDSDPVQTGQVLTRQ